MPLLNNYKGVFFEAFSDEFCPSGSTSIVSDKCTLSLLGQLLI